MKKALSISTLILLSLTLVFTLHSCKKTDKGAISAYVSAGEECPYDEFLPNFGGENIYGYRADEIFFTPSVQAGGYDESGEVHRELGVNFFALTEAALVPGDYTIDGGSGTPGTGYLFYFPDKDDFDNQFVSEEIQEDNPKIRVHVLSKALPLPGLERGEIEEWNFTVSGRVSMRNISTNEVICITGVFCHSEGAQ
jgi:hypothetical protein